MDNYHRLSDDAKQAWQRGYDLAHPRHMPARSENSPKYTGSARETELARAVEAVGDALNNLGDDVRKSFMAVKSGAGVNLVVMDPVSVEAVIVELDNMNTDECREALGDGFLKGMVAKAKAAKAGTPDHSPTTIN
jgi:hypothetical protein